MEQDFERHWNVLEYNVWMSVENLIIFRRGSELAEPATLAPTQPLAPRLSHGSHFGADYSWRRWPDVPAHWVLSLGHSALKAVTFSVNMDKKKKRLSTASAQSPWTHGRWSAGGKEKKKHVHVRPIKDESRVGVGFLDLKPRMWCQTAFPKVSIRVSLRLNGSQWGSLRFLEESQAAECLTDLIRI